MTDNERFLAWLNGTDSTGTKTKSVPTAVKARKPSSVIVLNAELAKPIGIVGGLTPGGKGNSKRTGYVGLRTYSREHTSDITVTTAAGDVYTVRQSRRRKSTSRTTTRIDTRVVVRDTANDYSTRLARFGATGNVE